MKRLAIDMTRKQKLKRLGVRSGINSRRRWLRRGMRVEQTFEEMLADPRGNTFLIWANTRRAEWRAQVERIVRDERRV